MQIEKGKTASKMVSPNVNNPVDYLACEVALDQSIDDTIKRVIDSFEAEYKRLIESANKIGNDQ